jgi:hypothetical protein
MNSPDVSILMVYSRMLVLVEHMRNQFLIEKILTLKGHADNGELVRISYEMVTLTVTFWTHKDRFAEVRADLEWLVSQHSSLAGMAIA